MPQEIEGVAVEITVGAIFVLLDGWNRFNDPVEHDSAATFRALHLDSRSSTTAVSYYGARTMPFIAETARAPLMFHFGGRDRSTPPEDIARHRELQPQAQLFVYDAADHAFNRNVDPRHFHAESAALAKRRTLDFLAEHTS